MKRFSALFYALCIGALVSSLSLGAGTEVRKLGSNDLEWGSGTTTSSSGKVVTKIPRYFSSDAFTDNLTLYGKGVTGDNTGNVSGFDNIVGATMVSAPTVGSTSYTDNGYFADFTTKGPWVDVRAFGTITFGASPTDGQKTANTAAIDNAYDYIVSAYPGIDNITKVLYLPPGDIYIDGDTLVFARNNIHLTGAGIHKTRVYWDNGVAFTFGSESDTNQHMGFSDLSLVGRTTANKVGLRVIDVQEMDIHDITGDTITGSTSIGLQFRGRDQQFVRRVSIHADRPVSIEDNPSSTLDMDHYHFQDTFLTAADNTQAIFHVDDGVNVTDLVIDGTNPWAGGKYGFYWYDNTTSSAALNVYLSGIGLEQPGDTEGWSFFISHNYKLSNLTIANCSGWSQSNALYLRKAVDGVLASVALNTPGAGKTALDIDNSNYSIRLSNVTWTGGAAYTVTGLKTIRLLQAYTPGGVVYADYENSSSTYIPDYPSGLKIGSGTTITKETWGATSVSDGGTISHSIGSAPTSVSCTPSVAGEMCSVTSIGSTVFNVGLKKHDGTSGTTQTVYWRAMK